MRVTASERAGTLPSSVELEIGPLECGIARKSDTPADHARLLKLSELVARRTFEHCYPALDDSFLLVVHSSFPCPGGPLVKLSRVLVHCPDRFDHLLGS